MKNLPFRRKREAENFGKNYDLGMPGLGKSRSGRCSLVIYGDARSKFWDISGF
jgi:hypothetical protein